MSRIRMSRGLSRWSGVAAFMLFAMCLLVYNSELVVFMDQPVFTGHNKLDDEFNHPYFSPGNKVITPITEKYILSGRDICKGISTNSVIILVPSVSNEMDTRNILRRTWLGALVRGRWPNEKLKFEFRVAFIFGQTGNEADDQNLKMENTVYEDIVQGDFVDSYYNLTRKTLFGLKWVTNHCPNAKYVLKIDVDTFIHAPKLFNKISFYDDSPNGKIFGRLWEKSEPHRDGRWKSEENEYPLNIQYYPPYCDGPVYVISGSAVSAVVKISERLPYFHLEDVFVTGIVPKIAKINRINVLQNVDFRNNPEWECSFEIANDMRPVHLADSGYSPNQILSIWSCLVNGPTKWDFIIDYSNRLNVTGTKAFVFIIVIFWLIHLALRQ